MSTIRRNDPVRNKVCEIATYWAKPGAALTALQSILFDHGVELTHVPSFAVSDKVPDYTAKFHLSKGGDHLDTALVLSWHWMPSGEQVEVVSYLT